MDPLARIAALEARLARVEARTARRSEALQANYLTIDPVTKVIGATFTGLINALGLILPAGSGAAPPTTNRIIWQRASDGAAIADLFGYSSGGIEELDVNSYSGHLGDIAVSRLVAKDFQGNRGYIGINKGDSTNRNDQAYILFEGTNPSQSVIIFDRTGASDFLQSRSAQSGKISYGTVDPSGNITSGTGDFAITHPSAGHYTLTVPGATNVIAAVASAVVVGTANIGNPNSYLSSPAGFNLLTLNSTNGVAADQWWSFFMATS